MDSYLSMYLKIKIYEFLDENNNFIKKHCFLKKNYTKIKHHSIFLTAVHHTKKEVNYSLLLLTTNTNTSY